MGGRADDFAASLQDLALAYRASTALGIAPTDVHAFVCSNDLLPEGFRGSHHAATRAALSMVIHRFPEEDALLFVATNHGVVQGLLTSEIVDEFAEDDDWPLVLSPRELGGMLDRLRGPQVLVIAACHAGVFLDLGGEHRAVIATCAADDRYYWAGAERPCSPLLPALFGHWAGTTFEDRPAPPRVADLATAFEAARASLAGGYEGRRTDVPLWSGRADWPPPPGAR